MSRGRGGDLRSVCLLPRPCPARRLLVARPERRSQLGPARPARPCRPPCDRNRGASRPAAGEARHGRAGRVPGGLEDASSQSAWSLKAPELSATGSDGAARLRSLDPSFPLKTHRRPSSHTWIRSRRSTSWPLGRNRSSSGSRARPGGRVAADRRPAGLLPRHRHSDRVRALARDRRLRPLPTAHATRLLARARPLARPVRREPPPGRDHQDRPRLRTPPPSRGRPALPPPAAIGVTLRNRQQDQPAHVLQIAWRAQHRLHRQHERLRARGKPGNVNTIAVARELACFLWAAATADWTRHTPACSGGCRTNCGRHARTG